MGDLKKLGPDNNPKIMKLLKIYKIMSLGMNDC